MREDQVIVVGAGVIGLTTALVLRRAGWRVKIWANDVTYGTASHAAGAIWYPSAIQPREESKSWAIHSLGVFEKLADCPGSGVRIFSTRRYFYRPMGSPWWGDRVAFRRLTRDELPLGPVCGYDLRLPQIDMPTYLSYLREKLAGRGVTILQRKIQSLTEALQEAKGVVNCAGFGARELAGDLDLCAETGELLRLEHRLERTCLCHDAPDGPVYLVSNGDHTLALASGNWSRFAPMLANSKIVEKRSGGRPKRKNGVRLEREWQGDGKWVVHHYGHAGAGVTLSWGSAEHVLRLIRLPNSLSR